MSQYDKDSLGSRMKRYESVPRNGLMNRVPVIIRLDGKAFHTLTRGFDRPYDKILQTAMVAAAEDVAREMQGFKAAYHQSDEVSFLLTDYDTIETSAWFDYDQQKLASVAASIMTANFNKELLEGIRKHNDALIFAQPFEDCDFSIHAGTEARFVEFWKDGWCIVNVAGVNVSVPISHFQSPPRRRPPLAYFDGRAFNVPKEDVVNYFLWRAKDWERNSLAMYCSIFFSHKELQGKNTKDRHEMLHAIGKNWATDVDEQSRNGTLFTNGGYKDGSFYHWKGITARYVDIDSVITPLVYCEEEVSPLAECAMADKEAEEGDQ
jgi:tRNA(His) 5'-end guanylyltransferase